MFAHLVPWASILGRQLWNRHPNLVPWPYNHTIYPNLAILHGWEVRKWVQGLYLGLGLRVSSQGVGRGNGEHAHAQENAQNLRTVVIRRSGCPSGRWTRPAEQPSSRWGASLWRACPGNEEQLCWLKYSTVHKLHGDMLIYILEILEQGSKPRRWRLNAPPHQMPTISCSADPISFTR